MPNNVSFDREIHSQSQHIFKLYTIFIDWLIIVIQKEIPLYCIYPESFFLIKCQLIAEGPGTYLQAMRTHTTCCSNSMLEQCRSNTLLLMLR